MLKISDNTKIVLLLITGVTCVFVGTILTSISKKIPSNYKSISVKAPEPEPEPNNQIELEEKAVFYGNQVDISVFRIKDNKTNKKYIVFSDRKSCQVLEIK